MKTIEVMPNPYIALDADGVPQGVVPNGALWIGAMPDMHASRATGKARFYFPPLKDGKLSRVVPFTGDVVTSVLAGELLACTREGALACGISAKEFLKPEEALAKERAKALAYYRSVRGEHAEVRDIPREPTPAPEEAKPETPAKRQPSPNLNLEQSKGA